MVEAAKTLLEMERYDYAGNAMPANAIISQFINFDGALPTTSELPKHPLFFYISTRTSIDLSGRWNHVKAAKAFLGVARYIVSDSS